MKFIPKLLLSLLLFSAVQMSAQSPQDAALIDAAMQMNFIDWYRNATNGTYTFGIPGNDGNSGGNEIPESFFADIPYFGVDDYAPFQGTYYGKTLNRKNNRYGDSWLTLGNIDHDHGTICVKAGWYNGLVGDVHLEASLSQSNILTGQGELYYNGQAMYTIYMFIFLWDDWQSMKGVCVLDPLTPQGFVQTSTFVLRQ